LRLADYIAANANKNWPQRRPLLHQLQPWPAGRHPAGRLQAAEGFRISVYAEGAVTARSMVVSDSGIVYVGSRKAGKVYALVPRADKQSADVVTIAEGLENPIGVTLLNGALYVGEIGRVIRFDNIDKRYAQKPSYDVVKVSLPNDKWHGEKVIKASPDGKLYIPVGAPCNICDTDDTKSAKIYRMNADGSQLEEVARGVRNTVGFDFHPSTKQLWFTDNGRDELGDNTPSCELNVLTKFGQHFGFHTATAAWCRIRSSARAALAKSSSSRSPSWARTWHRWAWASTPASSSRKRTATTSSWLNTARGTARPRSATPCASLRCTATSW
jgi:glucose/arabinose dehydrogenase